MNKGRETGSAGLDDLVAERVECSSPRIHTLHPPIWGVPGDEAEDIGLRDRFHHLSQDVLNWESHCSNLNGPSRVTNSCGNFNRDVKIFKLLCLVTYSVKFSVVTFPKAAEWKQNEETLKDVFIWKADWQVKRDKKTHPFNKLLLIKFYCCIYIFWDFLSLKNERSVLIQQRSPWFQLFQAGLLEGWMAGGGGYNLPVPSGVGQYISQTS